MLKINEIFYSAQGEGSRVGVSSIFIRLAGCSAECSYCDTKDSWTHGRLISEDKILNQVSGLNEVYKNSQVVITGGEPFEQNISSIVSSLKDRGFFVAVETNGYQFYDVDLNWFSVSPKDIYDYHIDSRLTTKINEIKLVVNDNLTLEVIKKIRNIGEAFPIYLQPEFYDPDKYKNTFSMYKISQKHGVKGIRLGFQLHRYYGIE